MFPIEKKSYPRHVIKYTAIGGTMSKNKRKHKITLEIGKFYRVLDGSPGGHPGQIYKIDSNDKTFYSILTGSMTKEEFKKLGLRKGYFLLKHPTDKNVEISLAKKRPFVGDRNDFGEKEYADMAYNEEDFYLIIKIQSNNPIYGKYYKKRKKIKSPVNGAAQKSVGRHQTSDDHDHVNIKANKRRGRKRNL